MEFQGQTYSIVDASMYDEAFYVDECWNGNWIYKRLRNFEEISSASEYEKYLTLPQHICIVNKLNNINATKLSIEFDFN
ncbi:MAG: hypothetical protein ACYCPT_03900 [Acidimicrobiales bacterium]